MVWLGVALVWPRTVDIRTSIAYRAGPAVLFSYIIRTVLVPGAALTLLLRSPLLLIFDRMSRHVVIVSLYHTLAWHRHRLLQIDERLSPGSC